MDSICGMLRWKSRKCIRTVENKGIQRFLVTHCKGYSVFSISGSCSKCVEHDKMTLRSLRQEEYCMTYLSAAKMTYIDVKTVSVRKETVIKIDTIRNSSLSRQHWFVALLHVCALCWFCYKSKSALTIHYLGSVGVSPQNYGYLLSRKW